MGFKRPRVRISPLRPKKPCKYKAFCFCNIMFYLSCRRFVDDRLFFGFLDFFYYCAVLLRINHPHGLHVIVHNAQNLRNLRPGARRKKRASFHLCCARFLLHNSLCQVVVDDVQPGQALTGRVGRVALFKLEDRALHLFDTQHISTPTLFSFSR